MNKFNSKLLFPKPFCFTNEKSFYNINLTFKKISSLQSDHAGCAFRRDVLNSHFYCQNVS